ncbi:HsdM family class I SAM-dependent methyltransferase [Nonomuraea rubra]
MMASRPENAQQFLTAVYEKLGFERGALVQTSSSPIETRPQAEWRELGEWLLLGERVGAERIFFVRDDPVVLFSELPKGAVEADIVAAYRRAWSLGRARCLFLALEGELRVYALTQPPPRSLNDEQPLTPLEVVSRTADVADRLAAYRRDRVESGTLFEDDRYRKQDGRADQRLLRDVHSATDALVEHGLTRSLAHALIERVILVRYLEDRQVIGRDYLTTIAARRMEWQRAIIAEPPTPSLGAQSTFISCLNDASLTYAVFEALAKDFNGDMFVVTAEESDRVTLDHLLLVQKLLTGAGLDGQDPLFLWAYDFGVVPTSLISSMYEQFYQAGSVDNSSTHYTPQELVEYVLAQTLTPDVLKQEPRVCDPACGSGIFLVEAFRRIVRHEMAQTFARPTPSRLRTLLRERVAGIDINPEAIQLAAFSLYLAYLNYLDPRDIRAAGPLPRLVHRKGDRSSHAVLVVADAFTPMLSETIDSDRRDSDSVQRSESFETLPWPEHSFGVVVGNPPWDEPRGGKANMGDSWAKKNKFPVGDRSPSQLFMWRALSLLRPGGTAALLVAAMAFHNTRHTSKEFRRQWLDAVDLESVTNFASARYVFFAKAVAPFLLIKFKPRAAHVRSASVLYRTVRLSSALTATRSIAYASTERRWVDKQALRYHDYLWKTYAWGSHHDAALMARLDSEQPLREVLPADPKPGWGYQYGNATPSDRLASLPSLRRFDPWGPLRREWFEPSPEGVKRQPDERLYRGQRIIISRGIRSGFGPTARLLNESCSFRHTIYCLPLEAAPGWHATTILGVILSSLGRYRLFMRSGSWGLWHDCVTAEDILSLPIRLAGASDPITRRIASAVNRLQTYDPRTELFGAASAEPDGPPREILHDLDEAVFDLFDLTPSERDLVNDFHDYTIDLVGRKTHNGSVALQLPEIRHGTVEDVRRVSSTPLRHYLYRFLTEWNRELEPDGEFSWRIVGMPDGAMTAALFETRSRASTLPAPEDEREWQALLHRLSVSLPDRVTTAVTAESVVRAVSDTSIVVVKRSDARLWTATAAREDVEATMLQAMELDAT